MRAALSRQREKTMFGMETLWWIAGNVLWAVWSILVWIVVQLFWLTLWILLPLLLAGILALRAAELLLGAEVVRAWVRGSR